MVTRTRLNKTSAHWLSCQYKERNGYWFYVCRFYTDFIALRHICHSNEFILCTETGIAQSLQLLGYVLCNRGPRVRFRPCKRLYYTKCRPTFGSVNNPTNLVPWALSVGVKRPGLQAYSYIIQCLSCKMYGVTSTLLHMAWSLISDRKIMLVYL